MSDFEHTIDEILRREGWPKYTNIAADRGGPTKGGITLQAWRDYTGDQNATADDVQAIEEHDARDFYLEQYVTGPKFDQIPQPLADLLIDCGVNHGPYRATKWLQAALGVTRDGVLGPITLAAAQCTNTRMLFLRVLASRIRLFGAIVSRDKQLRLATQDGYDLQAIFAAGWNNRAAEFLDAEADRQ